MNGYKSTTCDNGQNFAFHYEIQKLVNFGWVLQSWRNWAL